MPGAPGGAPGAASAGAANEKRAPQPSRRDSSPGAESQQSHRRLMQIPNQQGVPVTSADPTQRVTVDVSQVLALLPLVRTR
jgi:hypothetical protein